MQTMIKTDFNRTLLPQGCCKFSYLKKSTIQYRQHFSIACVHGVGKLSLTKIKDLFA